MANPAFTGREADLEKLGERLQKSRAVAVTQTVALHGLGGVGKTQLAVAYAWNHLGGYEAVLWVRADSPETLDANLARLAGVQLSDAEPLSRRVLEIFLQFRAATGHEHPHQRAAIANYVGLLGEMGRSPAQIRQVKKLAVRKRVCLSRTPTASAGQRSYPQLSADVCLNSKLRRSQRVQTPASRDRR